MATSEYLTPDQKGLASLTFGQVIEQTQDNFPYPRFRPFVLDGLAPSRTSVFDPDPYFLDKGNADGIGIKPELAERLAMTAQDPVHYEGLFFDLIAMVESDAGRDGKFVLGIVNVVDVNSASQGMVSALARGAKRVCDEGRFAFLNGETAELGHRVSGYGRERVNLNAMAQSLVVPDKLITGRDLAPNQPIVTIRQKDGLRSNGLTRARAIVEKKWLRDSGYDDKAAYLIGELSDYLAQAGVISHLDILEGKRRAITEDIIPALSAIMGHDVLEQTLVPWHQMYPEITRQLLLPSTLYAKLISEAQGWVDEPKQVEITGAAHISGGGIPEKVMRMVRPYSLGAEIEAVFPDSLAIQMLLQMNDSFPEDQRLVDDMSACKQWHRGIGFVVATKDLDNAKRFISLAYDMGYEAAVAGKITDECSVKFRGHTFNYI